MKDFYKYTLPELFKAFYSNERGLKQEEATKRLKEYGFNKLPEGKIDSLFIVFIRQFQNSLIYILFGAAGLVFLMGESIDALIIFAVLVFNALMGTIQEGKAQNALLALKKITGSFGTVLRDGKEFVVPDSQIVPGDMILLQEGEQILADARIIFANTLKVDESSLTGESEPVTKTNETLDIKHLPVADQKNMVFKGSYVLSGNGAALVVATGLMTEVGKIAGKIATTDTEIPLKTNIRYLSRLIIITVISIGLILNIIGFFTGKSLEEMFVTTVALSVSIIPEGLPIVMTLVLAIGVRRMAKHGVLVKRLHAVEALGQTKIIAVDKTGTLTRNEMLVQRVYVDDKYFEITGSGYEPKGEIILDGKVVDPLNHQELFFSGKIAAFCANARLSFLEENNSWKIAGDPTEAAMLVFSEKVGFKTEILNQDVPKIFELPFEYKRKYHATIRIVDNENFLAVVGAPEKVLELCKDVWHKDGTRPFSKDENKKFEAIFHEMAQKGFRVVAYAIKPKVGLSVDPDNMPPLAFVGLLGMNDALRPEVKEAVEKVKSADIKVVMITGDHKLTAQAIAEEAGIWYMGDLIITGEEMDIMSDEKLTEKLNFASVFARVTPDHKFRIIQAYRRRGEVIAMTGDGVNDAPSLVAADLGVAMGKIGTEVAKEASDLVLLDDNFASLVSAAEEGRGIYKTIKKVILYLFSTSVGEVMVVIGALILGYPLPILAAQIIWLNFVTDGFLDVALAMEPKEKGLIRGEFKKPKKWIVDKLMMQRIFVMALPMAIGTLYLFGKYFESDISKAWTISLTTLAVFQWFNAWNCRSDNKSIFQMNPISNKFLIGATALVVFLQFVALHTPFFQKILRTTPLSLSEWITIILVAGSIILFEEVRKLFYRRNWRGLI